MVSKKEVMIDILLLNLDYDKKLKVETIEDAYETLKFKYADKVDKLLELKKSKDFLIENIKDVNLLIENNFDETKIEKVEYEDIPNYTIATKVTRIINIISFLVIFVAPVLYMLVYISFANSLRSDNALLIFDITKYFYSIFTLIASVGYVVLGIWLLIKTKKNTLMFSVIALFFNIAAILSTFVISSYRVEILSENSQVLEISDVVLFYTSFFVSNLALFVFQITSLVNINKIIRYSVLMSYYDGKGFGWTVVATLIIDVVLLILIMNVWII